MTTSKITGLPPATTPLSGTEEAEIVQGGVNKRVPVSEFGGGGSGAVSSVNTDTGAVIVDIQSVLSQTNKVYTETVDGYTYELSNFIDEEGVKIWRCGITGGGITVYLQLDSTGKITNFSQEGSNTVVSSTDKSDGFSATSTNASGANTYKTPYQTASGSPIVSQRTDLPTGNYDLAIDTKVISSNYTAVNGEPLKTTASLTITDIPSPNTGDSYTVLVVYGTTTIDGTDYTAGSYFLRWYDGSVWNNINLVGGSSIQTQLNNRVRKWVSGIDGTSVSATTTPTITYSQLIPAGTFVTGDVPDIYARATATGAKTVTTDLTIYVNTSNSISGATQVGRVATAATSRTVNIFRHLAIKGATTKVVTATSSADFEGTPSGAETTLTVDWTVDQYIIFGITHSTSADEMHGDCFRITN